MTPYYRDETTTLWLGDCREVLPRLAPASVDLIVTDPPYGVQWQSSRRRAMFDVIEGDDGRLDVANLIGAALRVLREKRHVYIFGPSDLSSLPLSEAVELIWDKKLHNPSGSDVPWSRSHERIQFAVYQPSKAHRDLNYGRFAARLRRGSVIHCQKLDGGVIDHPTEKPVELLRQLIEASSLFGETVLDPFAGVGSTGVAAKLEGRKAVLIEIDERYAEIAARRLSQSVLPLFDGAAS